jgi:hypothetical protein
MASMRRTAYWATSEQKKPLERVAGRGQTSSVPQNALKNALRDVTGPSLSFRPDGHVLSNKAEDTLIEYPRVNQAFYLAKAEPRSGT